ncbi:hypothetical protein Athai_50730 [Actinocatenispora thailandica]|uniref:Uncharacterized protein n=1 Tax=Actinocatenispora thailandica TaxID=227318 RepID=A0A7R7DTN7_9ACTN|nr:hypothetical protein [Actinocatenispora thailandica]BCJ37570.1 hypothetical protein Athai_50730 [Actinocatenispora thailandica]
MWVLLVLGGLALLWWLAARRPSGYRDRPSHPDGRGEYLGTGCPGCGDTARPCKCVTDPID